MIQVRAYIWNQGVPIPECDSCGTQQATYKVFVPDKIGIRLCDACKELLKKELK